MKNPPGVSTIRAAIRRVKSTPRYRQRVVFWHVALLGLGKVTLWCMFVGAYEAKGQAVADTPDGTILNREPYANKLPYGDWFHRVFEGGNQSPEDPAPDLTKLRKYYTQSVYTALDGKADVSVTRLTYASGGLRIRGAELAPKHVEHKLPVVLWCRGGIGATGAVTTGDLVIMSNWARHGFIVLSTQYRGGPGSEGHDEDGGADVQDVLSLVNLARSLPDADSKNIFLYGYSRGGMMAYQVLAAGAPVRAAVINSGVSDMRVTGKPRPDAKELEDIVRDAIPNYDQEKASGFVSRSAVNWAEKIHVPLLLLHGTADWRVDATQSLRMAMALQASQRPYDLVIFSGGTHVELSGDQSALDALILHYFEQHKFPEGTG